MTSGRARPKGWRLVFEWRTAPVIEPLMGYTGSGDTLTQVELDFPTAQAAIDYAERCLHGSREPGGRKVQRRIVRCGNGAAGRAHLVWNRPALLQSSSAAISQALTGECNAAVNRHFNNA